MLKARAGIFPGYLFGFVLLLTCPFANSSSMQQASGRNAAYQYDKAANGLFTFEQAKDNLLNAYENILSVNYSGDEENDFSTIMIILQMGVSSLLDEELSGGRDSLMKMLASQTQKRYGEMAELVKTFLGKEQAGTASDEADGNNLPPVLRDTIEKAINAIKNFQPGDNPDYNFAFLASIHFVVSHAASEAYLTEGNDGVLGQIAIRIKEDDIQSQKILNRWADRNSLQVKGAAGN